MNVEALAADAVRWCEEEVSAFAVHTKIMQATDGENFSVLWAPIISLSNSAARVIEDGDADPSCIVRALNVITLLASAAVDTYATAVKRAGESAR